MRSCWRTVVLVGAVALAGSSGLVGCGKDEFGDRTARVEVDGSTTTYEIDSCGLDGQTLFVVGRASGGTILQAVVGLEEDQETGVVASSGFTVGKDQGELGAFGSESWERRGRSDRPPGTISSARLRGSRIQLAGTAEDLDAQGTPQVNGATHDVSIDVRCDEQDDGTGS